MILDNSDDDEETALAKKAKTLRWRKRMPFSMADAFLERAKIDDARIRELAKDELAERRQRDQHHELEMARLKAVLNEGEALIIQWKELLMHLQYNSIQFFPAQL